MNYKKIEILGVLLMKYAQHAQTCVEEEKPTESFDNAIKKTLDELTAIIK
jgi:hypothetical protein